MEGRWGGQRLFAKGEISERGAEGQANRDLNLVRVLGGRAKNEKTLSVNEIITQSKMGGKEKTISD